MSSTIKTLIISVAFLAVTSVVCFLTSFLSLTFWWAFGTATVLLACGVIVLILLRKHEKTAHSLTVGINAVAMGFYLRSWYVNRGFDNPLWLMLLISVAAVAYLVLFLLVTKISFFSNDTWLVIYILASLVVYVVLVVATKTTWVSTLGFYGLLQMGFMVGLRLNDDSQGNELTIALLSTYSVLICAVIILLVALGADALDCVDFGFGAGSDSKKAKKSKSK